MKPEVIIGIIVGVLFVGAWLLVFGLAIRDHRYVPRHRFIPMHRA